MMNYVGIKQTILLWKRVEKEDESEK